MSESDSQNISAQDYDDAIEASPTDASSASSTRTADEIGADGWVSEDGPRRGKSPRMVVAPYSPATRETLLANLPPRPTTVEAVSVPHSVEPSSSQPFASSGGNLVPLNSNDVRNHLCLLTLSELEEIKALLTGRVEFQTRRSLGDRGKEKTDPEVEEIPPLKRQKRPTTCGSTPVLDALREGGEHTASFLDKVRTVIPTREAIRDLETEQLSHMMNDLFCCAMAAENVVRRDVVPLKESLAAKDKELTEKVQALEARIASAETEVEAAKLETAEMNEKMSSYANLSGFLCCNPQEAEAFFWAFIHNNVGEELAWRYGEWAYAKGRYEMQQAVQEALEESLDEKDFSTVMGVMPKPAPLPGPMPYADPTPADTAPALTKGWKEVHRLTGDLLPSPPTDPELNAATDQKRSVVEGTRTPWPRPILFGPLRVHGTALGGLGRALTSYVRTVRGRAADLWDLVKLLRPGNMWAVERLPLETAKGPGSTVECFATMDSSDRVSPRDSWCIGTVSGLQYEGRPGPRGLR
nr:serine/arginine repetitive matrix protein 2-like [Ipomoea batatas]